MMIKYLKWFVKKVWYYLDLSFEPLHIKLIKVVDSKDKAKTRAYIFKKHNIKIGKYSYGYNTRDIARETIIGAFCSIASDVKIGLMNHPVEYVSSNPFLYYEDRGFVQTDKEIIAKHSVIIKDDVWLGTSAVILPGVTIGRGAVVGAGAVVTCDIPPYEIWGGVPAKRIKLRFNQLTIDKLLKIDWPTWDDERIKKSIDYFYDVERFIEAFEQGIV